MPVVKHIGHVPPADGTRIWRYLDLAKFLSMLQDGALYFSSIRNMPDKYEGHMHPGQRDDILKAVQGAFKDAPGKAENVKYFNDNFDALMRAKSYDVSFINCWHMNEFESGAMWKVYGDGSIAIQTTVEKLTSSIDTQHRVCIGQVHYLDYESDPPVGHVPSLLQKRTIFDFEREMRAIVYKRDGERGLHGINVNVNLATLIERIYVGSGRGSWFVKMVKQVLADYSLRDVEVVGSAMDRDPLVLKAK